MFLSEWQGSQKDYCLSIFRHPLLAGAALASSLPQEGTLTDYRASWGKPPPTTALVSRGRLLLPEEWTGLCFAVTMTDWIITLIIGHV